MQTIQKWGSVNQAELYYSKPLPYHHCVKPDISWGEYAMKIEMQKYEKALNGITVDENT